MELLRIVDHDLFGRVYVWFVIATRTKDVSAWMKGIDSGFARPWLRVQCSLLSFNHLDRDSCDRDSWVSLERSLSLVDRPKSVSALLEESP